MAINAKSTGPARLVQLDVVRGVAILLVLGHHPVVSRGDAGLLEPLARAWFFLGWTGVDLFFVLSGFLIGGLLFDELADRHDVDVRRFLIRRALKIWPSYYVYTGVVFLLLCLRVPMTLGISGPRQGTVFGAFKGMAANLLHVQNYLPTLRPHTWSLAVEEHFYLLLPFLLVFLARGARDRTGRVDAIPALPWIAAGLVVACTTGRYLASLDPIHGNFFHILTPTHLRLDGLFLGVLLAYYARFHRDWSAVASRYRCVLLALGLLLIGPMMLFGHDKEPYIMPFGPTLLYLGYGMILCSVVSTPIGEGWLGKALGSLPARLVAFIGVYSYPIYLWHIDLAQAPLRWLSKTAASGGLPPASRWALFMAAYIMMATAIGIAMSRAIERPTLALRDRLFPKRTVAIGPDGLSGPKPEPLDARPSPGMIPVVLS